MTFEVYRITVSGGGNNDYTVDRSETFIIQHHSTFDTKQEAEQYVITNNLKHLTGDVVVATLDRGMSQRDVCLSDPKWMHVRRFFVGKPDIGKIKQALVSANYCANFPSH